MKKSNFSGKTEKKGGSRPSKSETPKRSYKKSGEFTPNAKSPSFKKNDKATSEKPFAKFRQDAGAKRPFAKKEEETGFKPYTDRKKDGFSKPFDGEKRPYRKREEGNSEFKPYSDRKKDGFSKPFDGEKRPYRKREEGNTEFKPYTDRKKDGFSKPFDGEKRPYRKREEGNTEFKPYTERKKDGFSKPFDGEKRPYRKREDGNTEFKPYSDRKKDGFSKPFDGEKRPYRKRIEKGGDFKPSFSDRKNEGFSKPFDREEKKPFFTKERDDKNAERPERKPFGAKQDKQPEPPTYKLKSPRGFAKSPGGKNAPKRKDALPKNQDIRLNRYIANSGVCSRREADELIASGQISVNNKTVVEMGYKVMPGDVVRYGKKILNPEKMVYVLLNKPKDYITTTEDPEERKTVMDLVKDACDERIYPVGRLDRNTTGLLLLTNDGELASKLSHPSNEIKKIYHVELDSPFQEVHFQEIMAGVDLEDGLIKPDDLGILTPDALNVGIEIHSGRNRIVRRLFEHFGYQVVKLDRTVYAGLTKKDVPRGMWRYLTEKELIRLKYML